MSDSEESNNSEQQQYGADQSTSFDDDNRRRTRRRESKKKPVDYEDEDEDALAAGRYEEDEDYHEPGNKKKKGKSLEKKKSKKDKKSKQDSDDENTLDDSNLDESQRSVPPLKIKLPLREKSKRSSKKKNEPDDSSMMMDEEEEENVDGNVASTSTSRTSSKGKTSAVSAQPAATTSTAASGAAADETPSGPTRRSERIFVSTTKKEREPEESLDKEEDDLKDFKIIHKDYCQSCRQGGELILCDYCPRAYHKVCLDNADDENFEEELPDDWCCPHCEKNGKPDLKELKQQQAAKKKKKQKDSGKASSSNGKPKAKEIENNDYCESCNQCGELLLCDTCPRAYHYICIEAEVKDIPSGPWSCPHCVKNGVEPPAATEADEKAEKAEKIICKSCRQSGGEILFCASCGTRIHPRCLNPPLEVVPETWYCLACSVEPLKGKVQRILAWRWKKPTQEKEAEDNLSAEDSTKNLLKNLKNRKPREREFFVKWKDMSYWHCSWIDDSQMQVFHSNMYRFYMQKNDMNNPTMFDEMGMITTEIPATKIDETTELPDGETAGSSTGMDQGLAASVAAKHRRRKRCHNLPPELEEKYIRYGIRPEWLQIHRIVNHRKSRSKMFYVIKWRDLAYEEVTVEPEPENCDYDIPNYQQKIDQYWDLKRLVEEETGETEEKPSKKDKKRDKKDKKKKAFGAQPKTDAKKKWEAQPDYIPEPLKLHEYQKEGINWLRYSWSSGIDTILADEMGLGKTIQTVVFLYSLYKEGHTRGPFLIAAPLSTIINWERELEDWAPDFYVVNYTGNKDSRIIIRENELSFDADAIRSSQKATRIRKHVPVKFHVLLTSYELINVDSALLGSIDWKVLVVDEAHRLKSNQSLFFRTLNSYNVGHKLLLTGTPLQNNLEELFNLLNFLSPDRFCDMDGFLNEFADIAKEEQVKKLHELLGPHLLRRLKADVLTGMPAKSEFILRVDLAPLQKKYYKYILTRNYDALNSKGGGKQVSLLNVVMDLKKCCNHPYLFPVACDEAPKTKFGYFEGGPLIKASGKLIVLHKMLKKLKEEGHRVLIFSQMTQMLDILEDFCEAEGYRYERIDGSITGGIRQEAIDRFNAPGAQQFVFLLSTRAGGLGINLATADTVVIYDSDWNPHNDIQALSRAHRIGQTNKVMIYRFVTRNSVEERITQVAKKKMMLTHLVVRPGLGSAKTNTAMSKQELDDILKFGTEQLFKEEEGKESEMIHYDDKAIGELLDRSQEGIEQKEMWANEYLSSFKVASYQTKEAEAEEDEEAAAAAEAEARNKEKEDAMNDPHYWEKLLGAHYIQYQENITRTLGKGKRVRKQVNYMDSANGQTDYQNNYTSDSSDFSVPSDASENDDDFDERTDGMGAGARNQKSLRGGNKQPMGKEKMPPLFTSIGPNTEVLGFTPKHRKIYLDLVMRFGLPSFEQNLSESQFYVRDLKHKSEKHLRAYTSLFFSHLCEPGDPSSLTFEDGVPKEGINVNQVLTRIGIISLIKRKVYAYQSSHDVVSLPKPKVKKPATPTPVASTSNESAEGEAPPSAEESVKDADNAESGDAPEIKKEPKEEEEETEAVNKPESMEVDEESVKPEDEESKPVVAKEEEESDKSNDAAIDEEKKEIKTEEADMDQTVSSTKMEVEESAPSTPAADTNGDTKKEEEVEMEEEELLPTTIKEFEFNIEDGGLTELHTLWYFEERELKPGHEHEIWNRRHDFWLLSGIVKHGYDQFNEICNDPDLAYLMAPFKAQQGQRDKFMDRRLKLLEQALVLEEQLRRFRHLENVEKYIPKPVEEPPAKESTKEEGAEEKEEEGGEDKQDKDNEKPEKEAPKAEPATDKGKVNGEKAEEKDKEDEGDKENEELILNPMVQKAANQLEDLLIDMKSDCARIPATVQRIPSIATRLQLIQRNLQQASGGTSLMSQGRIN